MDQHSPCTARHLASLPHGGRLRQARALFPGAPEPFIDLSTGIKRLEALLVDASPAWLIELTTKF